MSLYFPAGCRRRVSGRLRNRRAAAVLKAGAYLAQNPSAEHKERLPLHLEKSYYILFSRYQAIATMDSWCTFFVFLINFVLVLLLLFITLLLSISSGKQEDFTLSDLLDKPQAVVICVFPSPPVRGLSFIAHMDRHSQVSAFYARSFSLNFANSRSRK